MGSQTVCTSLQATPSESAGWGQPALSATTASSHTHMGYRGSCQPRWPPFPGGRLLHSSCPRGWGSGLALLITGPGPHSEMLSFQKGGGLEVPDRALFLGLDSEEVPPGLRQHGVKWGQERRPGECGSQEGLEEATPGAGPPEAVRAVRGSDPPAQSFADKPRADVTCCRSHSQVGAEKQWRALCPPLHSASCSVISHNPEKGCVDWTSTGQP